MSMAYFSGEKLRQSAIFLSSFPVLELKNLLKRKIGHFKNVRGRNKSPPMKNDVGRGKNRPNKIVMYISKM